MKKSEYINNIKLSDLQDILRESGFVGVCYLHDNKHGVNYIRGSKINIFASLCCVVKDLSDMLDISPDDVLEHIRIGFED